MTWAAILKEAFCHCISTLLKCRRKIFSYHIGKFWAINSSLVLCAHYWTLPIGNGHNEVGLLVSFLFPFRCTTHCESFRSHSPFSSFRCKSLVKQIFLVNEICSIKIKTNPTPSEFKPKFVPINLPAKSNSTFCQFQSSILFSWSGSSGIQVHSCYLRTVQFDTRYKPTSSCTRVEVNDPTVARRFKTDRFISILSLIKFLCFSNVQLPSLLRGFDSRYWLSTIFIYSGFVIP